MARETLVLHSSLPLDRFETTLHETVSSDRWWREVFPVFLVVRSPTPVVGKFRGNKVRLRRLHYWVHNSFYPMFYLHYTAEPDGTSVEGYFDVHPSVMWFMRVWTGMVCLFAAIGLWSLLAGIPSGTHITKDHLIVGLSPLGFVAFGLLFPRFCGWLGSGDKQYILDYLENEVQAHVGATNQLQGAHRAEK